MMAIKMRLEMKNKSHRFNVNWPKPRHGHKYTKKKLRLSIIDGYMY